MKQMDEIIYYPSTRAILIQELKTALVVLCQDFGLIK